MAEWPYITAAWRRLRKAKLTRDPLCEYCPPGVVTPATQVDHRIAINDGGDPWAWHNLVSACASCHSRKTSHIEVHGRSRVPVRGCDASGRPLDPAHEWHEENRSELASEDRWRSEHLS